MVPFGGAAFIAGWIALAVTALKLEVLMKKLILLGLLLATPAFAHARLVSSDPAANAKVKPPGTDQTAFLRNSGARLSARPA